MFVHLRNVRSKIPTKNKILNPAYYGVIDLTGQYIGLKKSFSAEYWKRLRNLFGSVVKWQSIPTPILLNISIKILHYHLVFRAKPFFQIRNISPSELSISPYKSVRNYPKP